MLNKMKLTRAILVLAPLVLANLLHASGFALYEYSARGNAMGGAVLANKAEPASLASNPALITQLEGTQVQAGITAVIVEGSTIISGQKRDLKTGVFYLPTFFATQQMREDVVIGVGLFPRFGLGGRYKKYNTWTAAIADRQSYEMNLITYSLNPTIASKLSDEVSFGAGFEIMYASLVEEKGPGGANKIEIDGDSTTWGANFGLHYNPLWAEKWAAALTYRTKTRHLASGEVKGHGAYAPVTGDATAALVLPDQLAFGISFAPTENFVIEADIMGVFWSSYKQLKLDYDDLSKGFLNEYKHYRDVFRFSVGAEYSLNKTWDLRAGYVYDESPINPGFMDTMVPADDRHLFSAGVGYKKDKWGIDFSYTYMLVSDLSGTTAPTLAHPTGLPISYEDASSQMIGLSIKYAF